MDEQRAEFEAWASRNRHDIARMLANPAIYDCNYTQVLWEGWEPATQRQRERIAELQAQVQALSMDAGRLDWLTFHLSGKALRDIGVIWSEYADARAAIDAAIAAGKGEA